MHMIQVNLGIFLVGMLEGSQPLFIKKVFIIKVLWKHTPHTQIILLMQLLNYIAKLGQRGYFSILFFLVMWKQETCDP